MPECWCNIGLGFYLILLCTDIESVWPVARMVLKNGESNELDFRNSSWPALKEQKKFSSIFNYYVLNRSDSKKTLKN